MIVNPQTLRGIYVAFNTLFNKALEEVKPLYKLTIDGLIRDIMLNTLTLPLATASGEDLLTASGAPVLAVYHPQK